jgi:hypothetical protein
MDLEHEPLPYLQWLPTSLLVWLATVLALALGALAVSFLFGAMLHGPGRSGDSIYKALVASLRDLVCTSPRRVWAIARLSVQESIRRWVVAGLVVFGVVLAFALWFLNAEEIDPGTLYLDFVLTAAAWLVLPMAVLLSAFSLPNDIKNHTIYTIVTKPVRSSEIVLGRIVGFAAVGTALLVIMGLFSYLFVVRALDHTHELLEEDLTTVETPGGAESSLKEGRTSTVRGHFHRVTVDADGNGETDVRQGHWHKITAEGSGSSKRYVLGPPQAQFHARVPIYGKLSFRNRKGEATDKGINVGNEWTYRSYIDGGTPAAAIWKFSNVRRQDFPDRLPLEMTIRVFRTTKGDIEHGILGSYVLRNPRHPDQQSELINFYAKEFTIDQRAVDLKNLHDDKGRPIDLFDYLVDDGQLELELQCLQAGQYFGMAQPDVYLLPREASFEANFAKGYLGIWLQMLLVTTFGVMWSTFLNGAVAMLATFATLAGGFFTQRMQELAGGKMLGGGSFESMFRIVTQKSMVGELDEGLNATVLHALDWVNRAPMFVLSRILPDFSSFSDVDYVSKGFNIPASVLLTQATTAAAFLVPAFIFGFLCLKLREVAK